LVNLPEKLDSNLPTRVVIYATPNNVNPDRSKGMGDLLGAQTRMVREQNPNENLIVAYITPPGNKWPNYSGQGKNIYEEIQGIIQQQAPGQSVSYSIDGMSGGGSYQFNLINQHNEIPDDISQFTFFDSIYSYNSAHAQKLKRWLDRDKNHKLVGISGTLVGTQQQIMSDLGKLGVTFTKSEENQPWVTYKGMDGQISFVEMSRNIHGPTVDNKGFAYAHSLNSSGTSSFQVYAGTLNRNNLPPEFASKVA
jgi:hypothetical protein